MRGKAEANPEIPRFARNKLRDPKIDEIATPFGFAMTILLRIAKGVAIFLQPLFYLVGIWRKFPGEVS